MASPSIIGKYLRYRLQSLTKYGTHSPFVYDFIVNVLEDKNLYEGYRYAEDTRKRLLRENEKIEVFDLGTGGSAGTTYKRKIRDIARHSGKGRKYGRLLHRMVRYFKPATILELGTSLGLSSIYMATAQKNWELITLEGCPNTVKLALDNFRKAGIDNIKAVTGNIDETLDKTLEALNAVDFAFFDANHRKEPTVRYFKTCKTRSNEASVFVFDDIHWSGEMEDAWREIREDREVTLSIDLFGMGLVFFRRGLEKQHFVLSF